jgi:hypothetical protein
MNRTTLGAAAASMLLALICGARVGLSDLVLK